VIELISEDKCIKCGICVTVCPTNVFEQKKGEIPTITRKDDCQTCFMCEAYCPFDAMYVSPNAEESEHVYEQDVFQKGLLGSYRKELGWGKGQKAKSANDKSFLVLPLMHR
jgi:MinD superfamily P-loop ATPase